MVPENSAVIGLPNEMIVPLNAHHRGMCRFPSSYDQNYMMVESNVREIAFGEIIRQGSHKDLNEEQVEFRSC